MEKLNNKPLLVPLQLQLFAEDNGNNGNNGDNGAGNNGGQEPPKQKYSDEEYLKLEQAFDNSASEIANLKKQIKAKQTDEEQKAQAQAEKEAEIENMRKELTSIKTKAQLMKVFDEKDADTLTQCIVDNDTTKLLENLVNIYNANITKVKDQAKQEFLQSAHIPGSSTGNEENSLGKQMANSFKKEKPKTKVWGQFENK